MTIIVEDGSGVTGANSYVTEAELLAYATARSVTLTSGEETLLVQAMDYIESLVYEGFRMQKDQALLFPRSGVVIDGYVQDSDDIPQLLKNGQMETALAIDAGNGPLIDLPRSTKKEKVGEIEVEYMDGAASTILVRKINAMLWPILKQGSNGGANFTVGKG